MEGVSTKQPARMTLPRPPAGSGGFASWSFHCAYWGAYIIFVGLFALRVAPTPGRCYRAPPLRLPLGPDNFGPPNLSPDNNLLRSFLSFASIVLLLNGSWTRVTGRVFSAAILLLSFSIESRGEREIPRRVFFARLSAPATIKQGRGEGREVSHGSRARLMGTQFVAAAAYRRVYEAAALFRFYFGKNLAAYVTARIYARRAQWGPPPCDLPSSPSLAFASSLSPRFRHRYRCYYYYHRCTVLHLSTQEDERRVQGGDRARED